VNDAGFWPLSLSISIFKDILGDVYMSDAQITTFISLRIAIIIMLISMFILAIVANKMHKRRIKEKDSNIRKIKPFTVVAIIFSILAIVIGFGMILIVKGVGPSV
jgi:small-conductance mechanosensitive channel